MLGSWAWGWRCMIQATIWYVRKVRGSWPVAGLHAVWRLTCCNSHQPLSHLNRHCMCANFCRFKQRCHELEEELSRVKDALQVQGAGQKGQSLRHRQQAQQ